MNKAQFNKLLTESKGSNNSGIKYLALSLYEFIKSDGKYIINEETGKRTPLSEDAYLNMYSRINNTTDFKLLQENYNKSSIKKLYLIESDDIKVKNPESGKEISAKSAISGGPDHPAYKAAKAALAKDDSHSKDDSHKKDDSHSKDDSHGDHGDHGDHGSHGPKNLGRKTQVAIALVGVAAKALHVPGVDKLTAFYEKAADEISGIAKELKDVDGIINKSKSFGSIAGKKLLSWGKEKKEQFVASMTDEASGQRKSIGSMLKEKGGAAVSAISTGLVKEVEHLSHQLKGGVDVAKKVMKGGKLDDSDKDKIVDCIKGLATTVVIGLAIASGPMGMIAKAASIAMDPGEVLKQIMTADVYSDLQRKGLINVIKEHKNKAQIIRFLEGEVEGEVDSLDGNKLNKILIEQGSKELQTVKSPLNDYKEDSMDKVVQYTEIADEISDEHKKNKNNKQKEDRVTKENILRRILKQDMLNEIRDFLKIKK